MANKTSEPVGTYRVGADEVLHNASYECAAWYQDIEVQPGEYPVYAYIQEGRVKYFLVTLPGIVVASDFSSHFGGVRYGSNVDKDKGQPGTYHIQIYDYLVFESIHSDPNSRWHIDLAKLPNISVCIECGAPVTSYGKDRRCPTCGVAFSAKQEAAVAAKYPRLTAVMNRAHTHVGTYLLNNYVNGGDQSQYYMAQVKQAITQRDTTLRARFKVALAERLAEPGAKFFQGRNYYQTLGLSTDVNDWTIIRDDWRWYAVCGQFRQQLGLIDADKPKFTRVRFESLYEVKAAA